MTNTHSSTTKVPALTPAKSGQEIYDLIMKDIEPELTSDQISLLDEKYKDEADEQKHARGERYIKAYKEYDRRYPMYVAYQEKQLKTFKKEAFKSAEVEVRKKEENNLANLESAFLSA